VTNAERQVSIFIAHARSLLGARWRHRGRKPWALDCVGLLYLSARAAGWPVTDQKYYGREPWADRLRKELKQQCGSPLSKEEEWKEGDVALICWRGKEPTHVGIIANYIYGGLSLIHCENINGCVEQFIDDSFRNCIIEVYRPCAKYCQL
jgi:hypothetical protein